MPPQSRLCCFDSPSRLKATCLGCRLGQSWCPLGTRTPIPPRTCLARAYYKKGVSKGRSPFEKLIYDKKKSHSHARVLMVFTMVRAWEGVSERQWRSGANRSPLPLRSVLDAPHRGAGPEPAGETGVGRTVKSEEGIGKKGNSPSRLWRQPPQRVGLPPSLREVSRLGRDGGSLCGGE